MKKSDHFPRVLAILDGTDITYHYVESFQEAIGKTVEGKLIGSFETQHYMQNEKRIQDHLKERYETKK